MLGVKQTKRLAVAEAIIKTDAVHASKQCIKCIKMAEKNNLIIHIKWYKQVN